MPPLPLTLGFHSVLPASPSVLSSGDLFGLMAIGVLKAKVPVEEEDAEIAQTTVQSQACLPLSVWGRKVWGKSGWGVLVGWTNPDRL